MIFSYHSGAGGASRENSNYSQSNKLHTISGVSICILLVEVQKFLINLQDAI